MPVERVRTWGRAFERMVDHLSSLREDGNDRFFVQHIQAADQAEKLAQRGEAIYGRPPEFVSRDGTRDRRARRPRPDRRHRPRDACSGPSRQEGARRREEGRDGGCSRPRSTPRGGPILSARTSRAWSWSS